MGIKTLDELKAAYAARAGRAASHEQGRRDAEEALRTKTELELGQERAQQARRNMVARAHAQLVGHTPKGTATDPKTARADMIKRTLESNVNHADLGERPTDPREARQAMIERNRKACVKK